MPIPNIIAVICDFDDTLGDDSTNLFLGQKLGMDENEIDDFWNKEVKKLITKGWDPPLAYIDLILERIKKLELHVTNQDLRDLGGQIHLHPGVRDLFSRLRSFVEARKEFREANVQIESYIISGGFEEIIRGTPIAGNMKGIFGCTFNERRGRLVPKSVVTFTEKTKFLYAINKGVDGELRRNPYGVNDVIPQEQRRIPFPNMIYIGDGPTDIPCFSTIQQYGGKTIGILKYDRKAEKKIVDKRRAWAIARGDRATLGPFTPDYRASSDLYINLQMQVERVGLDIVDRFKRRG